MVNDDIFKIDKEKLKLAHQRNLNRWNKLKNIKYTKEQEFERIKEELEIYNEMKVLTGRAMTVVCYNK